MFEADLELSWAFGSVRRFCLWALRSSQARDGSRGYAKVADNGPPSIPPLEG